VSRKIHDAWWAAIATNDTKAAERALEALIDSRIFRPQVSAALGLAFALGMAAAWVLK